MSSKILCTHILLIYTCSAFPCEHAAVISWCAGWSPWWKLSQDKIDRVEIFCLATDHQPNGCILSCYRPPTTLALFGLVTGNQPHDCTLSCYSWPRATSLYFVLLQATSHIPVFCLATGHQPHPCIFSCYSPPATSLYFVLLHI